MKVFTCQMCGNEFQSDGNRANYCPSCRAVRQKERSRLYYQKIKNQGEVRNIGDTDFCTECGEPFVRKSGSQKVCENCRARHNKKQRQAPHDSYVSRKYDAIRIYVPKGEREKLKELAARWNISLNQLFNYGISLAIEKLQEAESDDKSYQKSE